ncbi:zinc-binding dehydrogenase [Streptomyces ardesiacus]|uniref:Zinc-binding dehydrogenase n=1 Tax=Streptomyces ardesiacus TaxID=285564 RepID=A0ABW8HHY5_9ACTN
MGAFGLVEPESAGQRFENGGGGAREVAALQFRVVLHAHVGQRGDLAAAQPRHPAPAAGGQSRLLGGDPGSPRGEELADLCLVVQGTLVATDGVPEEELWPGLLAVSDVMGTGWWAAEAAEVGPGSTAVVVGDGAVGLSAVIAAKERGAERIIAMSRHEPRQKLARAFGATDIVTERGEEGVARIRELTGGIGADSVLECVGTAQAMGQALHSARPGGNVGFVGVPHEVAVDGQELFFSHVGLRGGPAPVRRYLPDLIDRVLTGAIDPGRVFDLTLPLSEVAEGYRAMDERRAVKTLLKP